MLTWINEKAKWVIVIFAAGIAIGLLAMDRVPDQGRSYPIGIVNDTKISYTDFDSRVKMIVQNQYQNQLMCNLMPASRKLCRSVRTSTWTMNSTPSSVRRCFLASFVRLFLLNSSKRPN